MTTRPGLDITEQWGRLNAGLVDLVDYIPDDKLDWSPREDMWGFRTIMSHFSSTRFNWLTSEGVDREAVLATIKNKDDLVRQLRESWLIVELFFSERKNLDEMHVRKRRGQEYNVRGHWIAFHLLEHDIHHRADVLHYLALLGIEHPEVHTP